MFISSQQDNTGSSILGDLFNAAGNIAYDALGIAIEQGTPTTADKKWANGRGRGCQRQVTAF